MYGHHPLGAGLDEHVVVELIEILFEQADLLGERNQQRSQRPALQTLAELEQPLAFGRRRRRQRGQRLQFCVLGRRQQVREVAGLLDIADAVDRRQELEQPLHVEAHGITPRASGFGSSVSSSAGVIAPVALTLVGLGTRRFSFGGDPGSARYNAFTSTAITEGTLWMMAMTSSMLTG